MESIPKQDCIFAACDDRYFTEHGPAFINSCVWNRNNCHVHVINPKDDTLEYLESESGITYSTERVDTSQFRNFEEERSYYASNRFLTVSRFLNVVPGVRYLILDIDCVVRDNINRQDWNFPLGLFTRPNESHPGMKTAAGMVYIGNGGKPFLDDTVQWIYKMKRQNHNRWFWFIDQMALSYASKNLQKGIDFFVFDQRDMDWEFSYDVNALVWSAKGPRKTNPGYLKEKAQYA